jgi:hypothetical protein
MTHQTLSAVHQLHDVSPADRLLLLLLLLVVVVVVVAMQPL